MFLNLVVCGDKFIISVIKLLEVMTDLNIRDVHRNTIHQDA